MGDNISLGEGDLSYHFHYQGLVLAKADGTKLTFDDTLTYNDSYFSMKGTEFNKNLALMTYPLNYSSASKEKGAEFFSTLVFPNAYYSPDYDLEDTPEAVKLACDRMINFALTQGLFPLFG